MSIPHCKECKFYVDHSGVTGLCRRYPPQIVAEKNGFSTKVEGHFPRVEAHSWCGEYQEGEKKPLTHVVQGGQKRKVTRNTSDA